MGDIEMEKREKGNNGDNNENEETKRMCDTQPTILFDFMNWNIFIILWIENEFWKRKSLFPCVYVCYSMCACVGFLLSIYGAPNLFLLQSNTSANISRLTNARTHAYNFRRAKNELEKFPFDSISSSYIKILFYVWLWSAKEYIRIELISRNWMRLFSHVSQFLFVAIH